MLRTLLVYILVLASVSCCGFHGLYKRLAYNQVARLEVQFKNGSISATGFAVDKDNIVTARSFLYWSS
jgi:hypothetical protein